MLRHSCAQGLLLVTPDDARGTILDPVDGTQVTSYL